MLREKYQNGPTCALPSKHSTKKNNSQIHKFIQKSPLMQEVIALKSYYQSDLVKIWDHESGKIRFSHISSHLYTGSSTVL